MLRSGKQRNINDTTLSDRELRKVEADGVRWQVHDIQIAQRTRNVSQAALLLRSASAALLARHARVCTLNLRSTARPLPDRALACCASLASSMCILLVGASQGPLRQS